MKTVKELIIEYMQKPLPIGLDIVEQSVPICFFGNIETAKVATIGINPAKNAFSSNPALPDREDFATKDYDFLTIEHAITIYNSLQTYFNRPYHCFFKKLETFVTPVFNCHYSDGTMVHIDIVPWATNNNWAKIPQFIKKVFIEEYKEFFVKIINESNIKLFFVNGKTVKNELQRILNLKWKDSELKTSQRTTVSIAWNKGIIFFALNRFIPYDHLRTEDRMLVQEALRRFVKSPAKTIDCLQIKEGCSNAMVAEPVIKRPNGRLAFVRDIIEPLNDDEFFNIKTNEGIFRMTKADFYRVFDNVVNSRSYRVGGLYHSPKVPRKAKVFLVRE